jgi:Tfp pilus assembly protein PilN
MSLNLASQPFVNSRPVRRLVFVLWCLSVLLIAANLFLYTRHFTGQQARRDRLDALTEREGRESGRLAELEGELAGFDLDWQNRQVNFLNVRIAERVFPWSRLFDRLTEALPRQVRLTRLRPRIESLSGAVGGPEETVRLEIRGQARREEAILEFVGELFEHAAFRDPNLSSETRRSRSKTTEFDLSVTYLPAHAAATPAEAAEEPREGEK